jgi:hypothetical protein
MAGSEKLWLLVFHEEPYTVAQLYGLPRGILEVFNIILYENEFQNPQIFQQTISLFPEPSTLVKAWLRSSAEHSYDITVVR